MKSSPLLLIALVAFPFFSAEQSGGKDSEVESREVKSAPRADFKTAIAPLLNQYCTSCDGGDNPKNDLSLEFGDERDVDQRLLNYRKLFEREEHFGDSTGTLAQLNA